MTTVALDQPTADFLNAFANIFTSIANLSIPEQRAKIKEMFIVPEEQLEVIAKADNHTVCGRHGSIPIRLFTPHKNQILPLLVYLHRGGWVYGSIQESEMICRKLANKTGAIVAAVEYRLSPENPFPVPVEDCYDATLWLTENAFHFSADPKKVIICGESAGGNLAASVALMARQSQEFNLAAQLLIYPILSSELNPKHYANSPDKSLLSHENMQFFWSQYLSAPNDGLNPLASPLKSTDFSGLPPCFILTAEHDALKHEGLDYKNALDRAGVRVQEKNYPGVIHGFLDLPLADDVKNAALNDINCWVKNDFYSN